MSFKSFLSKKNYSIYVESTISITDNSGIKKGKCIKLSPYSKKRGTKPSGIIKFSIKKKIFKHRQKKNIKGKFAQGVLVRTKKMYQRDTGLSFKSEDNALIILDNKNLPIASRIKGAIFRELKYFDLYPKIILMTRVKL